MKELPTSLFPEIVETLDPLPPPHGCPVTEFHIPCMMHVTSKEREKEFPSVAVGHLLSSQPTNTNLDLIASFNLCNFYRCKGINNWNFATTIDQNSAMPWCIDRSFNFNWIDPLLSVHHMATSNTVHPSVPSLDEKPCGISWCRLDNRHVQSGRTNRHMVWWQIGNAINIERYISWPCTWPMWIRPRGPRVPNSITHQSKFRVRPLTLVLFKICCTSLAVPKLTHHGGPACLLRGLKSDSRIGLIYWERALSLGCVDKSSSRFN